MTDIGKKVGYLKGLMEGMHFDDSDPNQKLLLGMVDLIGDLTERVETIDELLDDLNDYVESIDDDLSALEGDRDDDPNFDLLDEDEDDEDFFEDEPHADMLHLLHSESDQTDETNEVPFPEEVESLAAALCSECKRMFFVHLTDPEGSVYTCPHCHAVGISPIPVTPENTPIVQAD